MIHPLERARIEEFVPAWHGVGYPPADRGALPPGVRHGEPRNGGFPVESPSVVFHSVWNLSGYWRE